MADTLNVPLAGKISKQIGSLFVKREDASNRELIVRNPNLFKLIL